MNSQQEIQLASATTSLPAQVSDLWGPQGGGALGAPGPVPPGQQHVSPLHRIHRLLRGRYLIAIVLSLACAALGGVLGYLTQEPRYRSDGYIQIKPNIPDLNNLERVMPTYDKFVESQARVVRSRRVTDLARGMEDWKKTPMGVPPAAMDFYEDLDVQYLRGTYLIQVSYTDLNPDMAETAVKCVIRAYRQVYDDQDTRDQKDTFNYWVGRQSELATRQRSIKEQIIKAGEPYGTTDLEVLHSARLSQMLQFETSMRQAELALAGAQAALEIGATGAAATTQQAPLTAEQVAATDRLMEDLLRRKVQLELDLEKRRRDYGPMHRLYRDAAADLDDVNRRIQQRLGDYRQQPVASRISADGTTTITVTAASVEQLRQNVDRLRKFYEAEKDAVAQIGQVRMRIQTLQNELEAVSEQLAQTNRAVDQLTVEKAMGGRLQILSEGDRPMGPAVDRRVQVAALGFVGGGALPFILFMLVGVLDQRFRYSDDAASAASAGAGTSAITLLGILPNLPERLTDPEQAAIAAHCVHQIRTMLQINGPDDRRVFAVTSASPGDGKTSLTLALGLSFAASGSRTLLIDCDVVGGGLTARLNVNSPEGVLEAVASGRLLDYVRQTDIPELSILPVGAAHAFQASTLSPASLRRLVAEARNHYDTILIDTGPILGSLEASLVAVAADAVVLTVARGQHRPLVEKSLGHLVSIGARMAGVVFNRAQARDFGQSINRMSLRSISRPQGAIVNLEAGATPASRLGPVARAVASTSASTSTSKPANGNGHG